MYLDDAAYRLDFLSFLFFFPFLLPIATHTTMEQQLRPARTPTPTPMTIYTQIGKSLLFGGSVTVTVAVSTATKIYRKTVRICIKEQHTKGLGKSRYSIYSL